MRYIVISDIHGNWAALEGARDMLPSLQPDAVLFLGDYITDGADPQRVLRVLREIRQEYRSTFILGNREDYFLRNRKQPDPAWQPCSQTGSLWYTAQHLTEEDLDWFTQMPVSQSIHTDGAPDILICHGSPDSVSEGLLGSKNRERRETVARSIGQNLLVCGHTHRQEIYEIDGKQILFCPSLGLPIMRNDRIPSQNMVQLDLADGIWRHTFLTVSYDVETYIQDLLSGPYAAASKVWCRGVAATLRTQQNRVIDCLLLAQKLSEEDGCTVSGPLPEIYWEQAAQQMAI
ncbi:MAG: metallophosphoesterase [Clostridia bacterium]|nr:metallophosphoesterase [Clostridia bacterium]